MELEHKYQDQGLQHLLLLQQVIQEVSHDREHPARPEHELPVFRPDLKAQPAPPGDALTVAPASAIQ